jgi:hypothetical protein
MRRSFVSISISWKPSPIKHLQDWCSCPGLIIARQFLVVRCFEYNIRMEPVETQAQEPSDTPGEPEFPFEKAIGTSHETRSSPDPDHQWRIFNHQIRAIRGQ